MADDPLTKQLDQSLTEETKSINERLARADSVLGQGSRPARKRKPKPPPPEKRRKSWVHGTFSFRAYDHALLEELQKRCLQSAHYASKSGLVRAGLHTLAKMNSADLVRAVKRVDKSKADT